MFDNSFANDIIRAQQLAEETRPSLAKTIKTNFDNSYWYGKGVTDFFPPPVQGGRERKDLFDKRLEDYWKGVGTYVPGSEADQAIANAAWDKHVGSNLVNTYTDAVNLTGTESTPMPGSSYGALPLAMGGLALGGAGLLGARAFLARRRAAMVPPVPEVVPEVPSKGLLASAAEFGKQNWKPLALAGAGLYAANKLFGSKKE